MKIIEVDGKGNSHERKLPFKRGKDTPLSVLVPKEDEPIRIYYFKGGWNYGHPTFHVITEYGDMEQTDYKFMSLDEMVKAFGVSPEELITNSSVVVTTKDFFYHSNDQELGREARRAFLREESFLKGSILDNLDKPSNNEL